MPNTQNLSISLSDTKIKHSQRLVHLSLAGQKRQNYARKQNRFGFAVSSHLRALDNRLTTWAGRPPVITDKLQTKGLDVTDASDLI